MDAMTQKVSDWTLSTPELAAELRDEVEGNEFEWDGDALAELVTQLLSEDVNGIGRDFLALVGVRVEDARAVGRELEAMAQEPPEWEPHIDWEAVRNRLMGSG